MNKVDTGAGLLILAAIVFGGWLCLSYEQEKIREQRLDKGVISQQEKKPVKVSVLEKYAPQTFEVMVKRTTE